MIKVTIGTPSAGAGSGDMTKAVYDQANVNEQLVGLTSNQSLTNKTVNGVTLTASGSNTDFLDATGNYSSPVGFGDMDKATYDPQNIEEDAFDRSYHTGTQPISSVTNLQTELDSKLGEGSNNLGVNSSFNMSDKTFDFTGVVNIPTIIENNSLLRFKSDALTYLLQDNISGDFSAGSIKANDTDLNTTKNGVMSRLKFDDVLGILSVAGIPITFDSVNGFTIDTAINGNGISFPDRATSESNVTISDLNNIVTLGFILDNIGSITKTEQELVNATPKVISTDDSNKTFNVFGVGALCVFQINTGALSVGEIFEVNIGDSDGVDVQAGGGVNLFGVITGSTTVGDSFSVRRLPDNSFGLTGEVYKIY